MCPPPVRTVEATELPVPEGGEFTRNVASKLGEHGRYDDAELAAGAQEPGEISKIQVGPPEILVRVDADNRVEETSREREGVSFSVNRYDAVPHSGCPDSLLVRRTRRSTGQWPRSRRRTPLQERSTSLPCRSRGRGPSCRVRWA